MKKNIFLKSTIILLLGGCITKILGLIIKVYTTRILGNDAIALYSFVMPTYSLLLSIANFNIMLSVSKRVSETKESKKVIINATYIMFLLNTILILTMLLNVNLISNELLKNKDTFYPIIACTLTIPFVSLGYIIKGYFYGKQNVAPHMISNVLEQLFRLLVILFIMPKIIKYGKVISVTIFILISILNETFSILVFLFFLPKNIKIKRQDLKLDKNESKEIMKISIPSMSSRIIGNIGYFLEPVLLTHILLYKGLSSNYITFEYGTYNAYAISTLLFPSFFISAISNSLLPEITKLYKNNNIILIKKRIKESLLLSLLVGIICTSFIYIFRNQILTLLYKTNNGSTYIKILSPFFILFYLEGPLSTILISLNKIKECTKISIIGIIIKLITMSILAFLGFKIYALLISEIIDILFITTNEIIVLKRTIYE